MQKAMSANVIHYHATFSGKNRKTGKMLVTTTSENTCPAVCKHKQQGTCYAKFSWLGLHWNKVSSGARSHGITKVLDMVRQLPNGSLWRWNQAGDLPGIGNRISKQELDGIVTANRDKRGFTYTHKPLTKYNYTLIKSALDNGFAINYSADSIDEAIRITKEYNIPCVVTVSHDTPKQSFVKDGITFVPCPEQTGGLSSCTECGICAKTNRKSVIMFFMHGSRKLQWS